MKQTKILFVCLGNICRSPTAEGVFQAKLNAQGLQEVIQIDSAGTAAWHIGKSPDSRTVQAAKKRGYDLSNLRARQVSDQDFYTFDYLLAMDIDNYQTLLDQQPSGSSATIALFLDYAKANDFREVPDPYYGGEDGFEQVLDLVEDASDGLLQHLQNGSSK